MMPKSATADLEERVSKGGKGMCVWPSFETPLGGPQDEGVGGTAPEEYKIRPCRRRHPSTFELNARSVPENSIRFFKTADCTFGIKWAF
jgi:hypothetical protein